MVARIWDRKGVLRTPVGLRPFKLFTKAWNSQMIFMATALRVITARLKELIVPPMASLIDYKSQARFARVAVTFSSILNPVAFWVRLVMTQSGTVCHRSAVQNLCGSPSRWACRSWAVWQPQAPGSQTAFFFFFFSKFCCEPSTFWQWKMLMLTGVMFLWRALGPSAVVLAALA